MHLLEKLHRVDFLLNEPRLYFMGGGRFSETRVERGLTVKIMKFLLTLLQYFRVVKRFESERMQDCGTGTKISGSSSGHLNFLVPAPERFGPN